MAGGNSPFGGSLAETALQLCGQTAVLLGWRPDEFWAATPAEIATIVAAFGVQHETPPDASTLARLMEQFPDTPPEVSNG